jgi:carboxymethylenebutenolidase
MQIRVDSVYAAAVLPIAAGAISTDDYGLIAGDVSIPAGDMQIPGYRAMPATGASFPVVLVVHEIFGVHEYIRDVCRRLAKEGYLAVAPSLYERQGDPRGIPDIPQIRKEIVSKVPDAQVLSDLHATVRWAAADKGDLGRLAITGFCWGGRIVWLYAAHSARLKAGAAWYGRLDGDRTPNNPVQPVDVSAKLKAPVIGFYGGQDHGIPPDSVEKMREGLKPPSEIIVYKDAGHGFHADYRPGYHAASAQDAWQRMLEFFRESAVA